ncbi:MAG: AAA family ATPase, partial [Dehalococcoidales bacterium]|nr:AAA family ATPase [Dehalococcoidales bacterium]
MAIHIAVAGKGGTGKTTVASLIVRYLLRSGRGTVLAVDADPNANFGESLGLKVQKTIGQVLHEFQGEKLRIPPGMT